MHHKPTLGKLRRGELVKKNGTSATSLKRRLRTAREKIRIIVQEQRRIARSKGLYAVAMTLTYRNGEHFAPGHITDFFEGARPKLKRMGHALPYVWTLERASALHYHLIVWLPRGIRFCHKDLEKWWPWGSTWIEACRHVRAWTRYISKSDDKQNLPPGARLFGSGGLDAAGKAQVFTATLPYWLRVLGSCGVAITRWHRKWVDIETGEIFKSPWKWTPKGFRLETDHTSSYPSS